MRAELVQRWPATRQFAPALLQAFVFEGAASVSGLLKAVALPRELNRGGKRTLPKGVPVGFKPCKAPPEVLRSPGKPTARAAAVFPWAPGCHGALRALAALLQGLQRNEPEVGHPAAAIVLPALVIVLKPATGIAHRRGPAPA